MRILPVLAAAVGGLAALAACTHEQAQVSFDAGYALGYDDKGETVALAYGLPNSDDLSLMLECRKHSGRVELTDLSFDNGVTAITLTSDGRKTAVAVHVQPTEGPGESVLIGRLASSAPALQGLRRSGVLQVSGGRKRYTIAVGSAGRAGVEKFFKLCG